MKSLYTLACIIAIFAATHQNLIAQEANEAVDNLAPQYLLGLLHAPEVHRELKLSDKQVADLEVLLRALDAKWFPARILPAEERRTAIAELESQAWQWFDKSATEEQRKRLRQLECYAQGNRTLFRSDIAKQIGLQPPQQQKLAALARAADDSQLAVATTLFGDPQLAGLQRKAEKTIRAEQEGMTKIVRPDQWQKLKSSLGEPFDTTRLKRIYAMAPEFAPVEHWINSSPLTMEQLRGKVVLVHFYAFQCHNCHANFGIYQRWHKDLTDKGVVMVGIQTPETSREKEPDAVKDAARERDLKFPIMIDLNSENWKAWGNTMWPCVYVVDKHGYIRFWWQGELNWKGATGDKTIEQTIDTLLKEE